MTDWLSCGGEIEKITKKECEWLKASPLADLLYANGEPLANLESNPKELTFPAPLEDDDRDIMCNFLRMFRPKEFVVVSWAFQTGPTFGGGAHFITAKGCEVCHTTEWVEDRTTQFKKTNGEHIHEGQVEDARRPREETQ